MEVQPVVSSPASGSLLGLKALIEIGLFAVAQVECRAIAKPCCYRTLSGDVANSKFGRQWELKWSLEACHLAPSANVALATVTANVGVILGTLGQVLNSYIGLAGNVGVNIVLLVGVEAGSANGYLPCILILAAWSPAQGCGVVGNSAHGEILWSEAGGHFHQECCKFLTCSGCSALCVVNELIATGAINYEATLAAIAATLPLNSVGLAVAKSYSAGNRSILATGGNSNGSLKHAVAVVELKSVAVPAVAIGVGELIANLALVGILASGSYKVAGNPNAGVLTGDGVNANVVLATIGQCVESYTWGGNNLRSPLLIGFLLVLEVPRSLLATGSPANVGTIGSNVGNGQCGWFWNNHATTWSVGESGLWNEVASATCYSIGAA